MTGSTGGIEQALSSIGDGRLAVRMPNWLGDAMFALPALRSLRRMAPKATLEVYARRGVADVLRACSGLGDRVLNAGLSTPSGILREARALRGASASVLFPNSFASAMAPWIGRVPLRFGVATDGRGPLLTHRRPPGRGLPQAEYYLAAIGLPVGFDQADAQVTPRSIDSPLALPRDFALLVPGAAFGPAKCWTEAGFIEVGRQLRGEGLDILVLGSARETELARRVAAGCGGTSRAGQTDGAGFVGHLAGAAVAVVNDSGALHLAAALGTPVVAIYGATDPAATGPITGRRRVLYQPVDCSPCGLRVCTRPTHACMEGVTSGAVLSAVRELREEGGGRR